MTPKIFHALCTSYKSLKSLRRFKFTKLSSLSKLSYMKKTYKFILISVYFLNFQVTFFLMPLEIIWAMTVSWWAGDFVCRMCSFFRIFGLFLSSNIVVCISIDRYLFNSYCTIRRVFNFYLIKGMLEFGLGRIQGG